MIINSTFPYKGQIIKVKYSDLDSFTALPYGKRQQVYGVCFYKGKMLIVFGEGLNEKWSLVGGHIEKGESFKQTLQREVQEETNMRVLEYLPVGVQEITTPYNKILYQLRYCANVVPLGKFEKDPAGSVTKIKLINPKDYKKYFDWGEIGERIIQRAINIKSRNFKHRHGIQNFDTVV